MIDLIVSQLTDVFRIGLIVALVVTMYRTAAVTGRAIPLALGVLFVAVIVPTTVSTSPASLTESILIGLVSNLIILIHVLAVARLIERFRR